MAILSNRSWSGDHCTHGPTPRFITSTCSETWRRLFIQKHDLITANTVPGQYTSSRNNKNIFCAPAITIYHHNPNSQDQEVVSPKCQLARLFRIIEISPLASISRTVVTNITIVAHRAGLAVCSRLVRIKRTMVIYLPLTRPEKSMFNVKPQSRNGCSSVGWARPHQHCSGPSVAAGSRMSPREHSFITPSYQGEESASSIRPHTKVPKTYQTKIYIDIMSCFADNWSWEKICLKGL